MRKVVEWQGQPGFNGRNFAAYRHPNTGKAMLWKDEFGEDNPDGIAIASPRVVISDIQGAPGFQPRANEIIAYLEEHPYLRNNEFRIRDLDAEEEAKQTTIDNKAGVLAAYYSLTESELRKVMTVGGLDASGSALKLQGRIQMIIDSGETGIKKLHNIMATQDKEYRLILHFALKSGLMYYGNNRYRLGGKDGDILGFEEDQIIRWMKDNQSEYKFLVENTQKMRVSKGIKDSAPVDLKGEHINKGSSRITSAEEAMKEMSFVEEDAIETIPHLAPGSYDKSYAQEEGEMDEAAMLRAAEGLKSRSFKAFADPNLKKDK